MEDLRFIRDNGACKDTDPEIFFPIGSKFEQDLMSEIAKGICAGCSVRLECLEYALETGQLGTWGGLTEDERKASRRRTLKSSGGA